ncbi:MAG: 1-deoxy-D-xylulose-5-phosphate reductoisomerase [Candidatus Bipolaricaulota bacterium]
MAEDVVVLGSTGSIGTQTLEVISELVENGQEHFNVKGLACGSNTSLLARQIRRYEPEVVSVKGEEEKEDLLGMVSAELSIRTGRQGLNYLSSFSEGGTLVNSLVGFLGLEPTLKGIGKADRLLLANKESLVVGGRLVKEKLEEHRTELIPIDSEHNAIFQALESGSREEVEELLITASGGPFLEIPLEEIEDATPAEALDHPNWDMGSRITCDSASMVNKGLEVIEAHWLFGIPYDGIKAVVHPQSVIHSLVQFRDGSMMGEIGPPDMKVPIQYALTYPRRRENDYERLNPAEVGSLEFRELSTDRYPAFDVIVEAGRIGDNAPAAVNGADEALIDEFLAGGIKFGDIARGLELVLEEVEKVSSPGLDELKRTDEQARRAVDRLIERGKLGR